MGNRGRRTLVLEERVFGAVAGAGGRGVKRSSLVTAFPDASVGQVTRAIWRLEDAGRIYQRSMTLEDSEAWGEPWRPNQRLVNVLDAI